MAASSLRQCSEVASRPASSVAKSNSIPRLSSEVSGQKRFAKGNRRLGIVYSFFGKLRPGSFYRPPHDDLDAFRLLANMGISLGEGLLVSFGQLLDHFRRDDTRQIRAAGCHRKG